MFKGYFYDEETGFYYLKTRYYAPIIGRFISMDAITYMDVNSFNGVNLYSYCNNNPVMYADENGNFPTWAIIVAGVIAVCAIVAAILIVKNVEEDVIPAVKKVLHTIDKGIKNIKNSLISDYNSLKNIITTGLERAYNSTRNFFVNTWGSIKEYATNVWDSVSGFFADAWTSVSDFFVEDIPNFVTKSRKMMFLLRFNNAKKHVNFLIENTDSDEAEGGIELLTDDGLKSVVGGSNSFARAVTRFGGGGSLGLARACQEDWVLDLLFDPVW